MFKFFFLSCSSFAFNVVLRTSTPPFSPSVVKSIIDVFKVQNKNDLFLNLIKDDFNSNWAFVCIVLKLPGCISNRLQNVIKGRVIGTQGL